LGLISSVSNGVFLSLFTKLMLRVPSITAISIQAFECGLIIGIIGLLTGSFSLDLHWSSGVLGFLSAEQTLYVIFVVGFFTGAAQYASYAVAQRYFSPLVVASSYLMEPLVA
jgi:drug/metabolite transporter (DMT)-like permease